MNVIQNPNTTFIPPKKDCDGTLLEIPILLFSPEIKETLDRIKETLETLQMSCICVNTTLFPILVMQSSYIHPNNRINMTGKNDSHNTKKAIIQFQYTIRINSICAESFGNDVIQRTGERRLYRKKNTKNCWRTPAVSPPLFFLIYPRYFIAVVSRIDDVSKNGHQPFLKPGLSKHKILFYREVSENMADTNQTDTRYRFYLFFNIQNRYYQLKPSLHITLDHVDLKNY